MGVDHERSRRCAEIQAAIASGEAAFKAEEEATWRPFKAEKDALDLEWKRLVRKRRELEQEWLDSIAIDEATRTCPQTVAAGRARLQAKADELMEAFTRYDEKWDDFRSRAYALRAAPLRASTACTEP